MARFTASNLVLAAVLSAVALVRAGDRGSLSGTVVATGLVSPADVVISLQAQDLPVEPPTQPVEIYQDNYVFVPHIAVVVGGTTVRFLNSDAINHSVFSPEGRYDLGSWSQGKSKEWTFRKAGVFTQLCHQHPEMNAFIIVLYTPYFAKTNKDGAFEILDVPAGRYT